MPIPNPTDWYAEQHIDNPDKVSIYDGDDYPLFVVESREADDESGMEGYAAVDLVALILKAVGSTGSTDG